MDTKKKQVEGQGCTGATSGKAQTTPTQFDKEQIAASARYSNQRDLVNALLEEGKKYTIETVDSLIEKYKKGKVK